MISLWSLLILLAVPTPSATSGLRAWVSVRQASVRAFPDEGAPIIGYLDLGSEIGLERCVPSCDARKGWAVIHPQGAVRLSLLAFAGPENEREDRPFLYGRVRSASLSVRAAPESSSPVVARRSSGDVLAFFDDSETAETGWLEWVGGGHVPRESVKLLEVSSFEGEREPVLPLAFITRTAAPRDSLDRPILHRFDRSPVVSLRGQREVQLEAGFVPRGAVRLAFARPRPPAIPDGARWVHVDLREQVLTAYEGDHPVFATLVSTGKPGFETRAGTYQVWLKVKHGRMRGSREPYDVEEVPSVLFFHGSEALHGTFWHSGFGAPLSHGCVNLSVSDASWLFDWAPPKIPPGWHSILPASAAATLYVVVEHAKSEASGPPR